MTSETKRDALGFPLGIGDVVVFSRPAFYRSSARAQHLGVVTAKREKTLTVHAITKEGKLEKKRITYYENVCYVPIDVWGFADDAVNAVRSNL